MPTESKDLAEWDKPLSGLKAGTTYTIVFKGKGKADLTAAKTSAKNSEKTATQAKSGTESLKKAAEALDKDDIATAKSLFEKAKTSFETVQAAVADAKKFYEKAKDEAGKSKPDLKSIYEAGKGAAEAGVEHAEKIEKAFGDLYRAVGSAIEERSSR